MHGRRPLLALLAVSFAAMPSAAVADTAVSIDGDTLQVVATGAEDNTLSVRPGGAGLRIMDAGGITVTAEAPCAVVSGNAECPSAGIARVAMRLGDGDDRGYAEQLPIDVQGEAGDDQLYGGDTDDVLDGGEGDDAVSGGGGNDELRGGGGRDLLLAREGAPQMWGGFRPEDQVADRVIDCGDGDRDYVSAAQAIETPIGCEGISPEWNGTPTLTGTFVEGGTVSIVEPLPIAGTYGSVIVGWQACAGTNCMSVANGSARSLTLTAAMVGRTIQASLLVSGTNGSVELRGETPAGPVVAPSPPTPPA
ncbi:MAG TPA: hypothetical protein VN238_11820, partial [Solirubrobacteraceae bacterium]|nr:hypothetical protein [Solirubrobacteraceae bacterium]